MFDNDTHSNLYDSHLLLPPPPPVESPVECVLFPGPTCECTKVVHTYDLNCDLNRTLSPIPKQSSGRRNRFYIISALHLFNLRNAPHDVIGVRVVLGDLLHQGSRAVGLE